MVALRHHDGFCRHPLRHTSRLLKRAPGRLMRDQSGRQPPLAEINCRATSDPIGQSAVIRRKAQKATGAADRRGAALVRGIEAAGAGEVLPIAPRLSRRATPRARKPTS